MSALSHTELAWAAGFWDGEGCSTGNMDPRPSQEGRFRLRLSLSQSGEGAEKILARFQAAVNGLGRVRGPHVRKNPSGGVSQPIWVWSTQKFEVAQAVVAMLWPYLSDVKRQQAARILVKAGR